MIKDNFFKITDLNQVVIIGWCPNISKIININSKTKNKNFNRHKSKSKIFRWKNQN